MKWILINEMKRRKKTEALLSKTIIKRISYLHKKKMILANET